MIDEVKEKYGKVIEYHNSISYDPRLDLIWAGNMTDMLNIINGVSSAEELIDHIDKTFMFSINFPPENAQENGRDSGLWRIPGDNPHRRERLIDWLLHDQEKRNVKTGSHLEESKFIHERNKVIRDGRVLSGNFLRTVNIAHQVYTLLGEPQTVLEIGGGCGHQARTLKLLNPNLHYTIIDLPETLCFSYTYLRLNFPERSALFITSPDDLAKADEYDFVFCPAALAEGLVGKSYDLFINTASMGEMQNVVIRYWMDFIQNRVNIKTLFTLNRFLNTLGSNLHFRQNENECSVHYDSDWEILNWEVEPPYCRSPYIDTLHSRQVEIAARRHSSLSEEEKLQKSKDLLAEVMDQDWVAMAGMFNDGIMTARDNVLVNDMTMTGTLFKLWESIRLNPHYHNVYTMIRYLHRLMQDRASRPFEEIFYYERILPTMPTE